MADIIKYWPSILINLIFGAICVELLSRLFRKKVETPVIKCPPRRKKLSRMEIECLKASLKNQQKRERILRSDDAYLVMRDAQVGRVYPWDEFVEKEKKLHSYPGYSKVRFGKRSQETKYI